MKKAVCIKSEIKEKNKPSKNADRISYDLCKSDSD